MSDKYNDEENVDENVDIDETTEEKLSRTEKNLERIYGQLQDARIENRQLNKEKESYKKKSSNGDERYS